MEGTLTAGRLGDGVCAVAPRSWEAGSGTLGGTGHARGTPTSSELDGSAPLSRRLAPCSPSARRGSSDFLSCLCGSPSCPI